MDAWTEYRTTLAQVRADVLSQPWAADANSRAQAENHLLQIEAAAYNMVIAPRPQYPELYVHTVFQPLVYNYSLHAADFLYANASSTAGALTASGVAAIRRCSSTSK